MLSIQPSIDARGDHRASFRALSVMVDATTLVNPQVGEEALLGSCASVAAGGPALGRCAPRCTGRGV